MGHLKFAHCNGFTHTVHNNALQTGQQSPSSSSSRTNWGAEQKHWEWRSCKHCRQAVPGSLSFCSVGFVLYFYSIAAHVLLPFPWGCMSALWFCCAISMGSTLLPSPKEISGWNSSPVLAVFWTCCQQVNNWHLSGKPPYVFYHDQTWSSHLEGTHQMWWFSS